MSSRAKKSSSKVFGNLATGIGIGLIILALFIMLRLFQDPLKQEIRYATKSANTTSQLAPPNTNFALVIDKLGIASTIVKDVDPYSSRLYQQALAIGIAHAKGTKLPGEGGNIFFFAHSSVDLLLAERYNSVFYLVHHLELGDIIKVWYLGKEYTYAVADKKIVPATDTAYLTAKTASEQLTLMTCWPPGTTFKRLIVIAKPVK